MAGLPWAGCPDIPEAEADARRDAITGGGPVDPDQTLHESPIAEALTGGMLDFEAEARSRAPDRRDPPLSEVEMDAEIWRAVLAVEIALRVWGRGELDARQSAFSGGT